MWTRIEPIWQETLALAWDAFCAGNVPVGCVIVNQEGEIVARGQNAIFGAASGSPLAGSNLVHAEMNALSQLKRKEHREIHGYSLYTSLEPCPMCFGASVMMGIRTIYYGGRDGIAGSAVLKEATPYLQSKKLKIERGEAQLELFQLALSTAFELKRKHRRQAELVGLLERDCPVGVARGIALYETGYFDRAVQEKHPVEQVFETIL